MKAKELLTGPLAAISTALTTVLHIAGYIDPLVTTLWGLVPTIYPALAISSSTIVPRLGSLAIPFVGRVTLPVQAFKTATLIGALIYVAYLGDKALDGLTQDQETEN